MSGTRSSSMDINLSNRNGSYQNSRATSAETRRLQAERLQSYNADNGNDLMPRLWDRAGAQQQSQPPTQHGSGQGSNRPNAA